MSIFNNDNNNDITNLKTNSKPIEINTYTVFFNNGTSLDIAAADYDYSDGTLDFFDDTYDGNDPMVIATFKAEVIYGIALKNKATLKSGFGYVDYTSSKAEYNN